MSILIESRLDRPLYRGKVRDTYDFGDLLLMVTTDRLSAFDVVLPTGIPDKGRVLSLLSAFWFDKLRGVVPNHLVAVVGESVRSGPLPDWAATLPPELAGRSLIVRKAERIDVECIVRGYLSASAWVEYQRSGTIGGMPLSAGLRESDRFPEPIFTPSTKADTGHDVNISVDRLADLVGREVTDRLAELSLAVYRAAADHALGRGLIIADTKLEFGWIDGRIHLIDEVLTPDSSRFWDAAAYEPGGPQASFDKQFVRDYLNRSGWDHEPPAPELPPEIVAATAEKYREAYRRLTGRDLPASA
ncbi:MAG TPA: phosphoribosylaminoimidazolesuccinocarboxamide synthase [Dehalococcoidia bacterium]|nr:phosphoribosylaminoimidazolesuccinocarboxamide synthase [Dehalococcoidia bacterium]